MFNKNYTILFRKGIDLQHEEEFNIARKYFNVVEYRSHCPQAHNIIGRYSLLPFYQELEVDLKSLKIAELFFNKFVSRTLLYCEF
jgi:hypothetical protein